MMTSPNQDGGIALVTDSSSQLTVELAERHGIRVVPVTVELDGVAFSEGVDLDADGFFDRYVPGETEVVSSQPSPARFIEAFEELAASGATSILCVHVGSAYSGTLDSARLAANHIQANAIGDRPPVPVRLVDTGMASFGVSCCLLAAAEQVKAGDGNIEAAAIAAENMASMVESVFILQGLELATSSGRFDPATLDTDGFPVLHTGRDELDVVGSVSSAAEAVEVMAARVLASGRPTRVASGLADQATRSLTNALVDRLASDPLITEIVHYRVGPSVAAHTGPGTAGVFYFPDLR